jgi:hypothetical protein
MWKKTWPFLHLLLAPIKQKNSKIGSINQKNMDCSYDSAKEVGIMAQLQIGVTGTD